MKKIFVLLTDFFSDKNVNVFATKLVQCMEFLVSWRTHTC